MDKKYINVLKPKNMVIRELVFSTDPKKCIGYGSEAVITTDASEEDFKRVFDDIMSKIKTIKEK